MAYELLIIRALIFAVTFSGVAGKVFSQADKPSANPVNIILFIGDGMGPAQLTAGMSVCDHTLAVEHFPYSGLCKTSSSNKYITDSAAAGTAIASGKKTKNGMIGMGPDSVAVKSIMEVAHDCGLATGIISTSSITHATPASFVAHNYSRRNYEDIAKDFMNGTIDVFIGGGMTYFLNRKDGIDLTARLRDQGYDVVFTIDELKISDSAKVAGLLSKKHMDQQRAVKASLQ
jgi:alkaline phosphatase